MITLIHHCPRCELRFRFEAELKEHLVVDHGGVSEQFERLRYPEAHPAVPLYGQAPDTRRYLIVANQTLGGDALMERIQVLAPAQFFVLVPATHSDDYATGYDEPQPSVDEAGLAQARWRLRSVLAHLAEIGVPATGAVGPPDPYQAIGDLLATEAFDEIILSTLPPGTSRWQGLDIPRRVQRAFNIPVTIFVTPLPGTGAYPATGAQST